ncbi:hypothetical protein [Streptomyces sp. NPDC059398]|uniref:hypothetical protein n=1 Tax=Streptomyces sp. NPDC059398 TaxID=3346820 RepID=UPI0036B6B205
MSLRNAPEQRGSNGAQRKGKSARRRLRIAGRLMAGAVVLSMAVAACSGGGQNDTSAAAPSSPANISASPHTASPTPQPTTPTPASPSPTTPPKKPVVRAVVSDHTDWNLQKAVADAHGHHVASVSYTDASELRRTVVHPANWKVCAQTPSAGSYSTATKLTFKVVESGESCAHPPHAASGGKSSGGGSSSSGGTGSGSGGSTSAGGGSTKTQVCSIRSNAGNCYRAGQFCRNADVGATTTDAAGRKITCGYQSSANRWHY